MAALKLNLRNSICPLDILEVPSAEHGSSQGPVLTSPSSTHLKNASPGLPLTPPGPQSCVNSRVNGAEIKGDI